MVPFKNLNVEDAVAFALRQVGAGWAGNYVSLVAILTLITVCISMTFALSRMIYSLARDGLLPKAMKQLDPKKLEIPKKCNTSSWLDGCHCWWSLSTCKYRFLLKYLYLGLPGYVGLCPLEIAQGTRCSWTW